MLSEAPWTSDTRLQHIHPLAPIRLRHLQGATRFPFELPFEPHDSLALYDCLQQQLELVSSELDASWLEAAQCRLQQLSPDGFFTSAVNHCISRKKAREYETELKKLMIDWASVHGGAFPNSKIWSLLKLLWL